MQSPEWRERLNLQYFNVSADIQTELASIQLRTCKLRIEEEEAGEGSVEEDEEERAHHTYYVDMLQQAIHRLSFLLVRMQSIENSFDSPVVQFYAFRTINKEGAWCLASEFAPFLSGMIHCIQLWLSAHCTQQVPPSLGNLAIEALIQLEC